MTVEGLIAFAIAVSLTPLVLILFRRLDVLDHPNERSSHNRPVVRGGGVAPAIACLVTFAATVGVRDIGQIGFGVVVAASGSGLIGLAEDIRGVPTLPRFVLQLAAATATLPWLLENLGGAVWWQLAFGFGVLFWLVAYVNAFNFMDGINGISALQALVVGVVWAWLGHRHQVDALAWGGAIIAGASLGFLPFNFPTARLFLGDVGSYFVGGWQAALLVVGLRGGIPLEAMTAPLAIYLADTGLTLVRRIVGGDRWYLPHREHVYQRLVRRGWSHAQTTLAVGCFAATCSLLGLLSLRAPWVRVTGDAVLATVLVSYLALPVLVACSSQDANGT